MIQFAYEPSLDLIRNIHLPLLEKKSNETGDGERDRRGRDGRVRESEGPGKGANRRAHFVDFKARGNSVLVIHSLRIISVALPFVDLKN